MNEICVGSVGLDLTKNNSDLQKFFQQKSLAKICVGFTSFDTAVSVRLGGPGVRKQKCCSPLLFKH
jgi:hypothetical protein